MDRILLGDNPFFGVNHMSEEKARAQAMQFPTPESIVKVLDVAYDEGIRVFMCTTHEGMQGVCDHFRLHRERYADFHFYPCMPYAHKYVNAVTERGILGALKMMLPAEGAVGAILKGGLSVARRDVEGAARLLIDAEMKMFRGLSTPVIFLQNVVTDFLLGLGFTEAFRMFADHVKSKYRSEPGFVTMNLPRLLDTLEAVGIDDPIVCAGINKSGFRMCGGIAAYEHAIATRKFRPIAMSVLASGALSPAEGLEYVCRQANIRSIVFGASNRAHIRETKEFIERLSAGVPATKLAPPARTA